MILVYWKGHQNELLWTPHNCTASKMPFLSDSLHTYTGYIVISNVLYRHGLTYILYVLQELIGNPERLLFHEIVLLLSWQDLAR